MIFDSRLVAFVGLAALLTILPGARFVRDPRDIGDRLLCMKTIGAGYLVWIGIQSIRDAGKPAAPAMSRSSRHQALGPFLQGFLTDVLNPKVAVFYLTFLPQFISPGEPVLRRSLSLAAIHIALGFVWLAAFAWFVDRIGAVLTRPAVKTWLERVTGGLLIALGARLAWERR